jgi:hypothetical protein
LHSSRYRIILGFLAVSACSSTLQSQNNTLYFMHPVPEAIHTSPALYYRCRTYVELPVISGLSYSYANTGFGYHDAMHFGSGSNADSLIIDINKLDRKLKKRNYIRNDQSETLLGAGFRIMDKYYVHFNVSNFTATRIGIPGDLVSLKDGNWDINASSPREINLSGLGADGIDYLQVAAGISTQFRQGIYIGITLKYLKGSANIRSQRTNLTIETEGDPIRVRASSDYSVRTSFPMQLDYDNQGFVSSIDLNHSFDNIVGDFILNKNNGGAIDLGVIYEYDEKLTLAGSIIDLGLIRWASNIHRFDANAGVDFMGFDLRAYAASGGSTEFLQALIDSVAESFQFGTGEKPYWTTLNPSLYTGASYQLYEKIKVSGLLKTELFDRRPHLSLTLAGMYSPFSFLHGTLSYSIMNNKLFQLGFGLAVGGPGAQFYIVSDHIPWRWVRDNGSGAIWPYNARTANLRFGLNLIFGCQEPNKKFSRYLHPANPRKPSRYCPAYH